MFTKALIVSVPEEGSNVYKVRIPLFEDTTGNEIIYDALCCHAPGIYGGLNPGDCVYIAFEDAKLNIPVIIGRLYVKEQDDYAKGLFNNLEVLSKAKLPIDTTFGNGITAETLYNMFQNISVGQAPSSGVDMNTVYPIGTVYSNILDAFDPNTEWAGTTWEYMYSIIDTADDSTIKRYWKRVA